jgi:hypothetical protein
VQDDVRFDSAVAAAFRIDEMLDRTPDGMRRERLSFIVQAVLEAIAGVERSLGGLHVPVPSEDRGAP